jgi:putative ABC transport system permease protein
MLLQIVKKDFQRNKIITMVLFIISVLITALFLKMLLAKDASQIAILRSIGFTLEEIRKQYQVRLLLVSGLGILLGTIVANTIGQKFALFLGSFMGASNIQFVVNPVVAYLILPLFFMLIVALTTVGSTISLRKLRRRLSS